MSLYPLEYHKAIFVYEPLGALFESGFIDVHVTNNELCILCT